MLARVVSAPGAFSGRPLRNSVNSTTALEESKWSRDATKNILIGRHLGQNIRMITNTIFDVFVILIPNYLIRK